MIFQFTEDQIEYTGSELRSHFAYKRFDITGDSLVAFCGPCNVKTDDLVDLADAKERSFIFSRSMLHFIGEFFDNDLEKAVLRQRLLMAVMKDEMLLRSGAPISRSGDDLYDGESKLTVSIATITPVSTMIHAGINISSKETPVKTKGLDDYGVAARPFAEGVLQRFREEMAGVAIARCKVRGVYD